MVTDHHMLLTGGPPRRPPGEPSRDSSGSALPRHSLHPLQEWSWVSQKLRPRSCSKSQGGRERGLSARRRNRLGKGFSKEQSMHPSWPPAGPQFRERRQNTSLGTQQTLFPDLSSLRCGLPLHLLFLCQERSSIHSPTLSSWLIPFTPFALLCLVSSPK